MGFDLAGRTVGVVGTGKIGAIFARIMAGFGCAIVGFDPHPSQEFEKTGGRYAAIEEITAAADVISLHCPLTPRQRRHAGPHEARRASGQHEPRRPRRYRGGDRSAQVGPARRDRDRHPELSDRFALPRALYDEGVRRYGFHGLSYEYVSGALRRAAPDVASGRVVIAHLGSGASACGLIDGRSIESTMGFTALDGLPMGTRSGSLDPGLVLHLIEQKGMTPAEVGRMLYHESGLIGLSGISNDVRELLASASPDAALAIDSFCLRVAQAIASLAVALGGLDGVVFTAGIGENAPVVRERVVGHLGWLGLSLDADANSRSAARIDAVHGSAGIFVIPTRRGVHDRTS